MILRILKMWVALFLLSALTLVPAYHYLNEPVQATEPLLTIEKGTPLKVISTKLEEQGVIQNKWFFMTYAHLMGKAEQLKAGDYLFEYPMSSFEVFDSMVQGKTRAIKARIIEGWNLSQIADYLDTLPFLSPLPMKGTFLKLAHDRNFLASLKITAPSMEGYLFPDTYFLPLNATPETILKKMSEHLNRQYNSLLEKQHLHPRLTQHQILTLASLIEKEAGHIPERPMVASVFYNRLAKGMKLQSDPTIIYGLKNFDGDIRKSDILNPHPYNTYVHTGLPPGPICSPGINAIEAALHPANTDYIYFVGKGDGTHHFSATATEHAEAVRKYQLGNKK